MVVFTCSYGCSNVQVASFWRARSRWVSLTTCRGISVAVHVADFQSRSDSVIRQFRSDGSRFGLRIHSSLGGPVDSLLGFPIEAGASRPTCCWLSQWWNCGDQQSSHGIFHDEMSQKDLWRKVAFQKCRQWRVRTVIGLHSPDSPNASGGFFSCPWTGRRNLW